ncbi:MAG: hypothetical protein FWB80_08140 [Defluviitaleaceae bacterium]|nr:hypothetical protein [Defluviitaleaceae bacterium]
MTPPSTSFDIVAPITEGMGTLVSQVTDIIGAVAPGAIAIVGSVLAIRLGINVFRSLVGR